MIDYKKYGFIQKSTNEYFIDYQFGYATFLTEENNSITIRYGNKERDLTEEEKIEIIEWFLNSKWKNIPDK